MDGTDNTKEMGPESLSDKEKEMLELFDGLDISGKIAAIHSFYSLACVGLIDVETEKAQSDG